MNMYTIFSTYCKCAVLVLHLFAFFLCYWRAMLVGDNSINYSTEDSLYKCSDVSIVAYTALLAGKYISPMDQSKYDVSCIIKLHQMLFLSISTQWHS